MIATSVLEIFKIGMGPSSSHTMGPMLAAREFRREAEARGGVVAMTVVLHGSLGATGRGHATDRAIAGVLPPFFEGDRDILWRPETPGLPHPNTLDFMGRDGSGTEVLRQRYVSVGGGFIERVTESGERIAVDQGIPRITHPQWVFDSAAEVGAICQEHGLRWWEVQLANEPLPAEEVFTRLAEIWRVMRACIQRGITAEGELPGGLKVRRRAPEAYASAKMADAVRRPVQDPVELLAHAYALAVNEENAAGNEVVTAPTNGAAGVIPAAFAAVQDGQGLTAPQLARGLLTAGLIGAIIKARASLSGAEMGCQGEVGSAAAMAAGGLVEMFAGTPAQVEMAAEIAIEHHLGMTCDPIGGLVQIPCIERNVMGAVKALNAASLALASDGSHRVSLDEAISAMREIGLDMHSKYKETSRGGLARTKLGLDHVEC